MLGKKSKNAAAAAAEDSEDDDADDAAATKPKPTAKTKSKATVKSKAAARAKATAKAKATASKDTALLNYLGTKSTKAIHYGQTTIYADPKNMLWRLKPEPDLEPSLLTPGGKTTPRTFGTGS